MSTFYAWPSNFDPSKDSVSLQYRLEVRSCSSALTGEGLHRVKVYCRDAFKNPLRGKWQGQGKYCYWAENAVFCCYTHKEAAQEIAREYGLTLK